MKNYWILLLLPLFVSSLARGQSFESDFIPEALSTPDGKSNLFLSKKYYKDGSQSLNWIWNDENAVLKLDDPEIGKSNLNFKKRGGIKIWICNENPKDNPLVFNFKDAEDNIHYTFDFNLNFTGWRAAWIAYSDMWTAEGGKTQKKDVISLEIISPVGYPKGEVWIDRVEFVEVVDRQATPDAQIPENNRHLNREIWHWGLLHKWEQADYDIPLYSKLSRLEAHDLEIVCRNIKNEVCGDPLSKSEKEEWMRLIDIFDISDDGKRGAPLLQKNNVQTGDVDYIQLNNLLDLSARSWYIDNNGMGKLIFVKTIKYMLHQGFAYESGMGTNHHYGYDIRDMAGAIWWMEDVLKEENLWEETRKAFAFWSGLQETRQPFNDLRDETTDSWNTLLLPRFAAAMMLDTEEERFRAMTGLTRWVNSSIRYTPGTIGGIKIDGTAFHHGGHYPAYAVPGFASIGQYLKLVNGTRFTLDERSRNLFKFALLSVARQMNLRDWGLAAAGRHPFHGEYGTIKSAEIQAFAYAAQAFDPIDRELAGQYLRLMEGFETSETDSCLIALFAEKEIEKAVDPQGFYVYNYASLGTYRYNDKMINLKGFTDVLWGSEIYTRDNRFGRYQSYGSVQIIGTKSPDPIFGAHPVTETASRFVESGWDWNRNPGTTTIHLPLELLNSPLPGTDMLRQPNTFSGSTHFDNGKYGMFAMKLGEKDKLNFTPSFNAKKSVFCFENRIICIGTDISNDNAAFPTETTLFQQSLLTTDEPVYLNEMSLSDFPLHQHANQSDGTPSIVRSLTGEIYFIPSSQSVNIERKTQYSKTNKTLTPTNGDFVTCYLNHGNAPQRDNYEYMILLDASERQIADIKSGITNYEIKQKDETAHIVTDLVNNVHAYAFFEEYTSSVDEFVLESEQELMIMLQPNSEDLKVSVCDPYLYFGEIAYTTSNESEAVVRTFTVSGKYKLSDSSSNVSLNNMDGNTVIAVKCIHGMPVEFTLKKIN